MHDLFPRIQRLANVSKLEVFTNEMELRRSGYTVTGFDDEDEGRISAIALDIHTEVAAAAERARLEKEAKKYEAELANAQRQLANQQFLAKAPAQVVEGIRRRQAELEVLLAKTRAALEGLP